MSKFPAARRSFHTGPSNCCSSIRMPSWRSCSCNSSAIWRRMPLVFGSERPSTSGRPSRSSVPSPSESRQPAAARSRRASVTFCPLRLGRLVADPQDRRDRAVGHLAVGAEDCLHQQSAVEAQRDRPPDPDVRENRMRLGRIPRVPLVEEQVADGGGGNRIRRSVGSAPIRRKVVRGGGTMFPWRPLDRSTTR